MSTTWTTPSTVAAEVHFEAGEVVDEWGTGNDGVALSLAQDGGMLVVEAEDLDALESWADELLQLVRDAKATR